MKKLSIEQILAVLGLSEKFPKIIWYTMVENANGREIITIQGGKGIPQEDIVACVHTVFPNSTFEEYLTSCGSFDIMLEGQQLGSLHLSYKEKLPAPTESIEKIIHPDCTIDLLKVEPLVDQTWSMEEILRQEG